MITETAALDPAEFTTGRVELALDQLGLAIDVEGVDWGEADVAVQLARQTFGASVTDRHFEPVEMTIPLIVKEEGAVSLAEAANKLEQKIGLLQQEGGWIRRDFDDDGGFAGSVGYQVLKASISGLEGWLFADQQIADAVSIKILRSPFCYSTVEVESEKFTENTKRELIWELSEVLGTAPGLIRIIVKNNNSSGDWRGLVSAIESRDHPQDATANTTAALVYRCADLTPKGGAEATGGIEPKVRAVGTVASGVGAISPGLPAGTVQGDLLIMVAESGGATEKTEANAALTAAGWSSPPAPYADQKKGNTRLTLLYKIASGGDATTTNDTGDHQVARIIGIEAGTFDSENPFNTAGVGTQGATKAVSIPGATTTRDRCLVLACASGNLPDAATTAEFGAATNASLTGLTELIDNTVTAGDGGAIYAVSGVMATKGAYGATTCTAVTEAERGVVSVAINAPYVVRHSGLTAGWLTILDSKIAASGYMTHKGVRRLHFRVYDPGSVVGNVQLRLRWRALGTLQWSENEIVPTPLVGGWSILDLGEARPEPAVVGGERWEWQVQARAVNGAGSVDLARVRVYPAEQMAEVSEVREDPVDGEPAKEPGTAEEGTIIAGNGVWASPNGLAEGKGTGSVVKGGKETNFLVARKFGFPIPGGAIIRGVQAEVHLGGGTAFEDLVVELVKEGAISGANRAFRTPISSSSRTYGGLWDLWGLSLVPTDINANFGLALKFKNTAAGEYAVSVGKVILTVAYTESTSLNRVCFVTRSIELRSDAVCRQHPTEDVWGPVVPKGFLPYGPVSGLEKRIVRGVISPSQGDLGERPDAGANRLGCVVQYRAAYLFAREAA